MDDVLILAESVDVLRQWFREIEWYLNRNLYLEIKDNWQIFPTMERGIDFIGYRIYPHTVMLRKTIWIHMKNVCKDIMQMKEIDEHTRGSFNAYFGWLIHCTPKVKRSIYNKYLKDLFKLHPDLKPRKFSELLK